MDTFHEFLRMDQQSFERLSAYVTTQFGIKLPEGKKSMLESRLNKKLKSLGCTSYQEFMELIFSKEGLIHIMPSVVDLITTNKTDFFREPQHFEFLTQELLPTYLNSEVRTPVKIWSAGCSTGEEPYTLMMVMEEFRKRNPHVDYSLLASDISTRVIQSAFDGVYHIDRIATVPIELKRQFFLRGKADASLVRVKPQFRRKIEFKRINLMDDEFGLLKHNYDIIFCRNVLIYFDKIKQEQVIRKFCSHLREGGFLFLGHSESIMGMQLPLKQIRPTIYMKV